MMAKPIMIQGTMSNAGKSLLTAGLCRIFKQDGYKTAPFKSQNMALNSYITDDGLEMGRAQAVQAEAAGIAPDVRMNPILLKPTTDVGSQVIVNGKSIGNMKAVQYFSYKKQLIPEIISAYKSLSAQNDIIVIEGAGSPAEINLKQEDIVNMGMAAMAGSPVLLAADIDRGGVFAQLYGTVMLLEPEERARIKGLIINKFRGDKTILDPGIDMIEKLCGIPVVGVVPFMDVEIEDEDSLSERLKGNGRRGLVTIAVIRLKRISNFTDFSVLSENPYVALRYVEDVSQLENPDMVIIPGSKSTMEDLLWMRQSGMEAAVLKLADKGVPIFGICGGYQILGEELADEDGAESTKPHTRMRGMGLLKTETTFDREKTTTRVKGRFGNLGGMLSPLSGMEVEGYEIHMGCTVVKEGNATSLLREYQAGSAIEKQDGCCRENIYGTYLHGVFDAPGVASALIGALLAPKGIKLEDASEITREEQKEFQYNKLAAKLRESLSMEAIYRILEEGMN